MTSIQNTGMTETYRPRRKLMRCQHHTFHPGIYIAYRLPTSILFLPDTLMPPSQMLLYLNASSSVFTKGYMPQAVVVQKLSPEFAHQL